MDRNHADSECLENRGCIDNPLQTALIFSATYIRAFCYREKNGHLKKKPLTSGEFFLKSTGRREEGSGETPLTPRRSPKGRGT
jgi:hypothetical protein